MWKPEVWRETQRTLSEPFLSLNCTRVDEFCVHEFYVHDDDWGVDVCVCFTQMTEKKKYVFEFHVSKTEKKKDKRGTLKERLLASAVALLLWDICLSFVDDDVFIFLVLGKKRKKKKANQKES